MVHHKNPETSKDVIIFENLINWDVPIILCEGVFDAMAIRRNAIPLLGKSIPNSLMSKIVSSKCTDIYIALDNDAKKKAFEYSEKLLNMGKNVYMVELQDKDPSEMGFIKFTEHIQSAQKPLVAYIHVFKHSHTSNDNIIYRRMHTPTNNTYSVNDQYLLVVYLMLVNLVSCWSLLFRVAKLRPAKLTEFFVYFSFTCLYLPGLIMKVVALVCLPGRFQEKRCKIKERSLPLNL